jgi:hypothetical protein
VPGSTRNAGFESRAGIRSWLQRWATKPIVA